MSMLVICFAEVAMAESDKIFSHSIAAIYDDFMGPIFFEPFAKDMAKRIAKFKPRDILETAAGSGIATEAIVAALPSAAVTASDLNQAMIDVAMAKPSLKNVTWLACDAMRLPFGDQSFDMLASQFGAMFFPDKIAAYREARRVLRKQGHFLFSVWDSLDVNPVPDCALVALKNLFPADPPTFMRRIPHGYFDTGDITVALRAAGFTTVSATPVKLPCKASSARDIAIALCQGTPMRAEIEVHDNGNLKRAIDAVETAVIAEFGAGPISTTMQEIVVSAS
jgi:SAM-dependent methyltransferase